MVAPERRADEDVWTGDAAILERRMELGRDSLGRARHRSRLAEPRPRAVVAAGAGESGDAGLDHRPGRRPIAPSGIEHDRGQAGAEAVAVALRAVAGIEQLP